MKRIIILSVFMVALFSHTAFASFTDVPGDYKFFTAINWMQKNAVVEGYSDGTFGVNQKVNRAEFLKILYETMGTIDYDFTGKVPFKDVSSAEWYFQYIQKAYKDGVIQGYPDGTFKPDNPINLAEAVKIVTNAFLNVDILYGDGSTYTSCEYNYQKNPKSPVASFDTGAWYWKYIYVADNLCIIPSTTNAAGIWGIPLSKEIARGDVAEMIYRAKVVHDNAMKKYNSTMKPIDLLAFQEFNIKDLKVGMKIGDLTVKSFGPFNADYSVIAKNNVQIVFEGETMITGKYIDTANDPGAFGPTTCFYPDAKSDAAMPHLADDEKSNQWFCFNDMAFAQSKFGSGNTWEKITIVIKNYTYVRYPSDMTSSADLVMVNAE